jgi:hypothetical protein
VLIQNRQISRDYWNRTRFNPEEPVGHYESFFQRANHPKRPLAFWIRYTIFSPRGQPEAAIGELWAVYFDGEKGQTSAAKEVFPLQQCSFSKTRLDVRIGDSTLVDTALQGQASSGRHTIRWLLEYSNHQPPLLLLPESFYDRGFPKAKAMVGSPGALFHGMLSVSGQNINVDGWMGSQNHNWGSKHTDKYAWGQVAGFEEEPEAFLELSTAQVKVGSLWLPWMTLIVLRLDGEEYALNGILQSLRAMGKFDYGKGKVSSWLFESRIEGVHVKGRITAPSSSFVGLRYSNPPGGQKICLNTKIAGCEVYLERPGSSPRRLYTENRAAFEILTEEGDYGVEVVA